MIQTQTDILQVYFARLNPCSSTPHKIHNIIQFWNCDMYCQIEDIINLTKEIN